MIRLAIISPNNNVYSETFIRAHVNYLDGEKFLLYGAYKPIYYCERPLVFNIHVLKRFFLKYVLKKSLPDYSIRYFLKRNKINIILAEYGPTGCAIMDIAEKLNIPLVVHFHGYDASSKKLIYEFKDKYKELFRYASRIIAVSIIMKENLIKMGANEKKVIYNPYGPASIFRNIVPDYDNSISALFVGRFVDKKAPWLLIELMNKIKERRVNIKLVMAGDGALLETCIGLVKIHGLEKTVIFKGEVKPEGIKDLMEKSFCYIQHSVITSDGETEGTPVSILEASQAGLPVIASKHAGISDIVIHGETGFLVEEFDIESMAEYLVLLYNDRSLAKEIGLKAKERIYKHFSLEKHISILNDELKGAIEEH